MDILDVFYRMYSIFNKIKTTIQKFGVGKMF